MPTVLPPLATKGVHIRRSEVTMIAGQPGAGKSLVALWMAVHWAQEGLRGIYFSADSAELGQAARALSMVMMNLPVNEAEAMLEREDELAEWRKEPDPSGSWEAHYVPVALEGNIGVAQGRTRYFRPDGTVDREFKNIFVLHFDEAGRCERFTEWYMQPRSAQEAAT